MSIDQAHALLTAPGSPFETEVVEIRPSKSRPGSGIVTFAHRAINQRDEIVCSCLRMALLKGKGTA